MHLKMGYHFLLFLILSSVHGVLAQDLADAIIVVKGATRIAETRNNFICATVDWWPPEKCNYQQCPWGKSSVLNLDLTHPLLAKAIQAFNPLRIRIGGTLQDRIVYDVGNLNSSCLPIRKRAGELFGFSMGCLPMARWDELNLLFNKTGALVTFGLNALYGRHQTRTSAWVGAWDSSNARDFIKYTISKGYPIDSWEFGNELSGNGVGASVGAQQYGKDLINLEALINELYGKSHQKPLIIAPGGFYNQQWYTKFLQVSGSDVVNVVTHHIYNLGPGDDHNLVNKILDPHYLSQISQTFRNLEDTIRTHGPWASAWVGEAGGAYNSGGRLVSDTFINSFWYLDQLGMSSRHNTKAYCRQSLIGGNYGLLNTATFEPNPDYYSALLWHRLMGKGVLAVDGERSPFLRAYAHCLKGRGGIILLLINLSNQTEFRITVQNSMNINLNIGENTIHKNNSFMHGIKRTVSWVGRKASDEEELREEYHLTPKDGYLQSQTMVLNGTPLKLNEAGDIPSLDPVLVNVKSPISLAPLSIAFVAFPNFEAQACK
ncbi:heparanase-like protein 1 [Macadamia integrifolia]|uniref:heparanase-like protein 1 n=1 Tax=Macadamia integrifolia TaxID=60698 RepID=UPI001C4F6D38|nr:heparanase-like protein 1 [Macadamia integrifolia]XP_042516630.1 heparanase-like protein 1 [Macadamia integrifolia]XP_042516631.1 heparanase-like protein 1 [Macadamia integrifolia]XP_042516632.1 heparanase-like protein 1 [Macadamia integrifolia]XP_042516633.1 heparanase-like protein 1 [Macadamia integrifolia]